MYMYINTTNRGECRAVYSRSWFGEKLLNAQKIKKQAIKGGELSLTVSKQFLLNEGQNYIKTYLQHKTGNNLIFRSLNYLK